MSCASLSNEAILKIADPMVDYLIAGINRREYQTYSTNFSVKLKGVITPEVFLAACDAQESAWGRPARRELISIFRKEKSFSLVWDLVFDQTDEQVALFVTVALKGGRYFVDYVLVH